MNLNSSNLDELYAGLKELESSQYFYEELNMGLAKLDLPTYLIDDNFFEGLKLTISHLIDVSDQIFGLLPDFLDFRHLHNINEKRQSALLTDILFYYNKNLSKILCFPEISSKLGHGFLGRRKGSSILAYYCSILAPLSSVRRMFTKLRK